MTVPQNKRTNNVNHGTGLRLKTLRLRQTVSAKFIWQSYITHSKLIMKKSKRK